MITMTKHRNENEGLLVQVSTRGQVTLPAGLRKAIGLNPGDPLRARVQDGKIVLEPVVVLPVEQYTDERIREFTEAAEMSADEIAEARKKWNLPDA